MLNEPPGVTYAESALQLGITPVYPPREDIQVGDVYAVERHGYGDYFARTALVATKNMTPAVNAYLASRYEFAAGTISGQTVTPPATDAQSDVPLMAGSIRKTLPIASFPEIEVNSGISLGVGGQPTGLGAALGFTAAKTLKMRLKYGFVTSYEVLLPDGVAALNAFCAYDDRVLCTSSVLSRYINQKYQLGPRSPDRVGAADIMMVTKVYLARSIKYTFSDAQLAAAVALAVNTDGRPSTSTAVVTQDMLNDAAKKEDPEVLKALAALMEATSDAATSGGEGGLKIAGVTASTVSIQEDFVRPVVIGYEAVSRAPNAEEKR